MKCLAIDFGIFDAAVAFFDESDTEKKVITIPYHGAASLVQKKTLPSAVFFDAKGNPVAFGARFMTKTDSLWS